MKSIVCDRRGWAFDNIATSLASYFPLYIFYKKDRKSLPKKNVLWMGWRLAIERKPPLFRKKAKFKDCKWQLTVDPKDALVGIHAHHDWDDGLTMPNSDIEPPAQLIDMLSKFKRVNVVSTRLYKLFKDKLPRLSLTLNGVDSRIFIPNKRLNTAERLRIGYAGTRKRDWKENISKLIDPLKELDFIDLKLATPQDNPIPFGQMPSFYNDIDVYLCASNSEGFSLSVLEAASCGRAVVSTRVGGSDELITDGYNGLFVEPTLKDIVEKLWYLHKDPDKLIEMGKNNRKEVEDKWSWNMRHKDWEKFIYETP